MFISPNATPGDVAKTVNGQLDNDNIRLLPAIALNKLATGALPTGITVASANIVNDTIINEDINSAAAIGLAKLANGALPAGVTVASANIVNDSIVNEDVNSAAAIAVSKTTLGTYSAWATWTPTWSSAGAGTLSSTVVSFARWSRIGDIVYFNVDATHTITVGTLTYIGFTLPVSTNSGNHIFTSLVLDGQDDTVLGTAKAQQAASSIVRVYRMNTGNGVTAEKAFSVGAGRETWVQGFYEVS